MTQRPYHNRESFSRVVRGLIRRADEEGRGDDLDRVVAHMDESPHEVEPLAALMLLLDEDWRVIVRDEIDAFRRWGKQKGQTFSDRDIYSVMRDIYQRLRNEGS
jgi:hypothetical protein